MLIVKIKKNSEIISESIRKECSIKVKFIEDLEVIMRAESNSPHHLFIL
jgi:hypothetical protein